MFLVELLGVVVGCSLCTHIVACSERKNDGGNNE